MYEEGDDGDNEFTNDNDFSQDEEDITELADDEEEEKTEAEKNAFKLLTFKNVLENIDKKPKKTIPIMTKFEKARVKGVRLQQLAYGAKPRVNTENLKNINEIVEKELTERKLPFIIRRSLPNGYFEDWRMEEFETI